MADQFKNFIGGEWVEPSNGQYFENRNPAKQSDLIGLWPRSTREDVDRAAAAARAAFPEWSRMPAPARGDILRRVGDLLTERKDEIARAATREMGKVLTETRGDLQEGIDTAYYAGVEGRRLFGKTVPSELRDKWAMSVRRPIGVCGLITPFNFPLAIPTWKMFPALVCGNTVVIKPAEDTPHTVSLLVEILEEAGIPRGVVNLVHGLGEEVGAAIVDHPDIPVISFTGSTETGSHIGQACGRMHKRLSLEMGGKNAQIVMGDADLELALNGVLWGAFGTTGQRCTATSRLLLQDGIHDEFVEKLIERAKGLKLGYGVEEGVDVGPLIHQASLDKVQEYVEIGRQEATLALGGERPSGDGVDDGFFFSPTIFTDIKPGSRMATEEIFGPVLSVMRFSDLDEAIQINNEVKYGLSSSL
ncbi:MAG TPA: aldehyde dehydrogenase family protein, partial [Longimicrobium sp.]|nr:aldehyde dehydrogenase family protein [Longimicrobium sp.]